MLRPLSFLGRRSRRRRVRRDSRTGALGLAGREGRSRVAAQPAAGVSGVAELAALRMAVGDAPSAGLPLVLGVGQASRLAFATRFARVVAPSALQFGRRAWSIDGQELQRLGGFCHCLSFGIVERVGCGLWVSHFWGRCGKSAFGQSGGEKRHLCLGLAHQMARNPAFRLQSPVAKLRGGGESWGRWGSTWVEHSDTKIRTSLQAPAGAFHRFPRIGFFLEACLSLWCPTRPSQIDAIIATARSRIRQRGPV